MRLDLRAIEPVARARSRLARLRESPRPSVTDPSPAAGAVNRSRAGANDSGRHNREGRVEHLSDHGLLALVGRGDREAFARLYDMYGGAAYSLALRIVRDRELAADVVQNVFLAVWTQATQFDPVAGAALDVDLDDDPSQGS